MTGFVASQRRPLNCNRKVAANKRKLVEKRPLEQASVGAFDEHVAPFKGRGPALKRARQNTVTKEISRIFSQVIPRGNRTM